METEKISLKEYFEKRFEASDKAVAAALSAAKEAVAKAENASEKRFDSVNEFRATLSDQQRNLMPRAEVEIQIKALTGRSDSNENRIIALENKGSGIYQGIGYVVGVIGIVSAIVAVIFRFID